jgi:hypothetical protein
MLTKYMLKREEERKRGSNGGLKIWLYMWIIITKT